MYLIRAICKSQRSLAHPHPGKRRVLRDAQRTVDLDCAIDDLECHVGYGDLDRGNVLPRFLVADRIHHVRRFEYRQANALESQYRDLAD